LPDNILFYRSFVDFAALVIATDIAALIIPGVGSNRDRHPKLQRFMLANDSVTVAGAR